jgi:hypothetical protein
VNVEKGVVDLPNYMAKVENTNLIKYVFNFWAKKGPIAPFEE